MIGPAEINIKLPVGGLGRAASPPAGSGAEPREPNAFQQKYNENGFKLLTIGREQACCRTVALLYTPKSDCVVSAVKTKLRPARLLVRPKPDQPDRLLRPCQYTARSTCSAASTFFTRAATQGKPQSMVGHYVDRWRHDDVHRRYQTAKTEGWATCI